MLMTVSTVLYGSFFPILTFVCLLIIGVEAYKVAPERLRLTDRQTDTHIHTQTLGRLLRKRNQPVV